MKTNIILSDYQVKGLKTMCDVIFYRNDVCKFKHNGNTYYSDYYFFVLMDGNEEIMNLPVSTHDFLKDFEKYEQDEKYFVTGIRREDKNYVFKSKFGEVGVYAKTFKQIFGDPCKFTYSFRTCGEYVGVYLGSKLIGAYAVWTQGLANSEVTETTYSCN